MCQLVLLTKLDDDDDDEDDDVITSVQNASSVIPVQEHGSQK